MDATIISIVAIVVSGLVGVAGVVLNVVKRSDADVLARATRRTMALQLLSDQELALIRVREEVRSFETMIQGSKDSLGNKYEGLKDIAERTTCESKELLKTVRDKRLKVEAAIEKLSASEIEATIAEAYHGKALAQGQLYRTQQSKADVLRIYLGKSDEYENL